MEQAKMLAELKCPDCGGDGKKCVVEKKPDVTTYQRLRCVDCQGTGCKFPTLSRECEKAHMNWGKGERMPCSEVDCSGRVENVTMETVFAEVEKMPYADRNSFADGFTMEWVGHEKPALEAAVAALAQMEEK